MDPHETDDDKPIMQVLTPDTTPEEVAAIVAVFSALGSGSDDRPRRRRTEWNRPSRMTRVSHRPGPGAWRSSGLPHG